MNRGNVWRSPSSSMHDENTRIPSFWKGTPVFSLIFLPAEELPSRKGPEKVMKRY